MKKHENRWKVLNKTLPLKLLLTIKLVIFIVCFTTLGAIANNSFSQSLQSQVSGTVTDDSGQPLPGVTVVIKGTSQGTVTDTDADTGSYSWSPINHQYFNED
jgi:hypothetical protein